MSFIPRQVPWISWSEWEYVKTGLYSTHEDPLFQNRLGSLEIVSLWRSRGGGLPHSIESTANLVEVHVLDNVSSTPIASAANANATGNADASSATIRLSEMALRLQYTLAIIRSVNGLSDPGQQGVFAESVLTLAQKRGIPAWIVEIRHDGTHSQLPPLAVLRSASIFLLNWYYTNYWEIQTSSINDIQQATSDSFSLVFPNSNDNNSNGKMIELQSHSYGLPWLQATAMPTTITEIIFPCFEDIFTEAVACASTGVGTGNINFNSNKSHFYVHLIDIFTKLGGGAVDKHEVLEILLTRLLCHVADITESLLVLHQKNQNQNQSKKSSIEQHKIKQQLQVVTTWVKYMFNDSDNMEAAPVAGFYNSTTTSITSTTSQHLRSHGYWRAAHARAKKTLNVLVSLGNGNINSNSNSSSDYDLIHNIEGILESIQSYYNDKSSSGASTSVPSIPKAQKGVTNENESDAEINMVVADENINTSGLWTLDESTNTNGSDDLHPWPLGLNTGHLNNNSLYRLKVVSIN